MLFKALVIMQRQISKPQAIKFNNVRFKDLMKLLIVKLVDEGKLHHQK